MYRPYTGGPRGGAGAQPQRSWGGPPAQAGGGRRMSSQDSHSSPPQKTRRVGRNNRVDDGRGRRPTKGDSKRKRKQKALAESAQQCQYYVGDHGLRRVRPYMYNFETHAKERWLGRAIIDVFSAEFGANPRSYYDRSIRSGLLTVNGKTVSPDYKLQNSDLVSNRTHRHEPPVAGGEITIVSESADELVVDKPCTIPVHPCGAYRFNTLFYILQRQRPELTLRVCHRLDRLTSGLTILAKTSQRAGVMHKQIGTGGTRKTYLARVSGDFGQNLPVDRRQAGSPPTGAEVSSAVPAESPPSADSVGKDAKDESSLPGDVPSEEKKEKSADAAVAVGVVAKDESPPASKSGDGEAPSDAAPAVGELWWRFETPRKSVVNYGTAKEGAVVAGGKLGEGTVESGASDGAGCLPKNGDAAMEDAAVRVNCPIRVLDPKDGVYECHPEGKEAQTVVRKVSYDAASGTSLVECTPVHGRTHQIRLHLQWIGHPIANDPCYGGELHFGNPEAKRRADEHPFSKGWKGTSSSRTAAAAAAAAAAAPAAGSAEAGAAPEVVPSQSASTTSGGAGEAVVAGDIGMKRDDEDDEAFIARNCTMCQSGEQFSEMQLHCLGIWLHALRYQGPDWSFETKMPSWTTI